jgi:hypothetical protein
MIQFIVFLDGLAKLLINLMDWVSLRKREIIFIYMLFRYNVKPFLRLLFVVKLVKTTINPVIFEALTKRIRFFVHFHYQQIILIIQRLSKPKQSIHKTAIFSVRICAKH